MANITIYKTIPYNDSYFKIFSGVYNDFKSSAASDYNFELEPLSYSDFIKSIEKGLLKCIILFEDDIPTGFLVYTTIISEAVELNIIHCMGNENINERRKLLLEKFMEITLPLMKHRIVTYPLLGRQSSFTLDIQKAGFKIVNTSVMSFNISDINAVNKTKEMYEYKLPDDYTITNWKTIYYKEAANVIHHAFKNSSDTLFDSRFTTVKGCRDILEKITDNTYGEFLPAVTKVLIYKKHIAGFCLANLTNDKIANIPAAAVLPLHRNRGFGTILLKQLIFSLAEYAVSGNRALKELNASCDSDNIAAVKMYYSAGFTREYAYPQAYHPKLS